jgi:Ankyrin repeats (many copies)
MSKTYHFRMRPLRSGIVTYIQKAVLLFIVSFFSACDAGRPSPNILNNAKELRLYLDQGGNPNGITKDDSYKTHHTLLHRAAIYGNEEIVKMLLSAGADPNAQNTTGWTPLMVAFTTREQDASRIGVIRCLLNVSDLTIKDLSGMTVHDYAKKYGSPAEVLFVEEAIKGAKRE